jgi:hypothetical protein
LRPGTATVESDVFTIPAIVPPTDGLGPLFTIGPG